MGDVCGLTESGFLGGVILGGHIELVRHLVQPWDFEDDRRHSSVWISMLRLRDASWPLTVETIAAELRYSWPGIGEFLDELMRTTLTADAELSVIYTRARIIRQRGGKRADELRASSMRGRRVA